MSEHVYFITIGLFAGTILLVFGMRYLSIGMQAKARLAADQSHRHRIEGIAADRAASTAVLVRVEHKLDELTPRVEAIEKLLKDVG